MSRGSSTSTVPEPTATASISVEDAVNRRRGDLVELSNGHYVATSRSREYIPGRVSIHRDGYGFLIPDHPVPGVSGDLYIGRDSTRGAMNGDRAIGRITHFGPHGRAEGEIVKILRRAHPTVVGQFRINRRGLFARAELAGAKLAPSKPVRGEVLGKMDSHAVRSCHARSSL